MSTLTKNQKRALYHLCENHPSGIDAAHLASALDTSPEGAARTASSLVRRGWAVRFVGGVGPQRVHWASAEGIKVCPHGCGVLDWIEPDVLICPRCDDEWHAEVGS